MTNREEKCTQSAHQRNDAATCESEKNRTSAFWHYVTTGLWRIGLFTSSLLAWVCRQSLEALFDRIVGTFF